MVRKARLEDAKDIVYINTLGWLNTYRGIFPDDFLDKLDPYSLDNIKKCQNKIDEYLIYEIDNSIVGILRYGKNKKNYPDEYGEIYVLYIKEEYKRKGIGKELVKYAFDILKENYKYILISTLKENPANEFYKKIGGKHIGTCDFILEDNKYIENIYEYNLF